MPSPRPSPPRSPEPPHGRQAPAGPARVLVAEDNPVNQILAREMITVLGFEPVLTSDGQEAVATLERDRRFALVLLDCQMPVMDGVEAARRIRAHESARGLPRLPVVALTASVSREDRDRCLASGMDDFMSKPFTLAELRTVLGRWLSAPVTASGQA